VLPGGQRQYVGGYSSHRGISRYGGNTQVYIYIYIYMLVAVEGHTPYGGLERRELKGGASRRI
jgi:hypothetical protein